jgi:F-type H+-transporting ATPase subunit alpha
MPIEEQVVIIHAAIKGELDDIELADVRDFELLFIPWLKEAYPEVLHTLRTSKELDDKTGKLLDKAILEFKAGFVSGELRKKPRPAAAEAAGQ